MIKKVEIKSLENIDLKENQVSVLFFHDEKLEYARQALHKMEDVFTNSKEDAYLYVIDLQLIPKHLVDYIIGEELKSAGEFIICHGKDIRFRSAGLLSTSPQLVF